jgi:hypothetical protein
MEILLIGAGSFNAMQRLLRRADWDVDGSAMTSAPMWPGSWASQAGC